MTAGIIPVAILSTFDIKRLIISVLPSFLGLVFFDSIHRLFGFGFYEIGFEDPTYYLVSVISIIIYLFIVASFFSLKRLSENFEKKLKLANDQLLARNYELRNANNLIDEQKEELKVKNEDLNKEVSNATKSLKSTNEILVKHNDDLRAFSSAVSHHLRGPVASLSGLVQMIETESLIGINKDVYNQITIALESLITSFRELTNMLDIRQEIYTINQKIILRDVIDDIRQQFQQQITEYNIDFQMNQGNLHTVYSNKARLRSILFNLVSNSIKFRSLERKSRINILAQEEDDFYKISVQDNGLGIDLDKYGKYIFDITTRFHDHVSGKGLGLYMVKVQTEILGGRVEVNSEVEKFTQFDVYLKKPENLENQNILDTDHIHLYFNAKLYCLISSWKKDSTDETEFRNTYELGFDFLKANDATSFISDISNLGPAMDNQRKWVSRDILEQAKNCGLKNIVFVTKVNSRSNKEHLDRIEQMNLSTGINIQIVHSFSEAEKIVMDLKKAGAKS